jgi:hypothetical protein
MGYAMMPAPVVTAQPSAKDARKDPSRGPTRTVGSIGECVQLHHTSGLRGHTQGIVETEVGAAIDHNAHDGGNEATVEALDTVCLEGLLIDVEQAIELPFASGTCRLCVAAEASSRIVQGVNEQRRRSPSACARCNVPSEPGLMTRKVSVHVPQAK